MEQIILAIATFFSTYLGGMLSIKLKDKLHLIMGFTAGVIIGVFSFDVLPEIINQIKIYNFNTTGVMIAFVAGFIIFHILEKTILIQHCHDKECIQHKHPHIGVASALALAGHSFMDGVGIGLGFQVSPAIGFLIAFAVIAHDFTDGMNTVTLMLINKNSQRKTKLFLLLVSVTPVLGAIATMFFTVPAYFLTLYLAFFGGFLVYIGASDILPEAHSEKSSFGLVALTVAGLLFIFLITRII